MKRIRSWFRVLHIAVLACSCGVVGPRHATFGEFEGTGGLVFGMQGPTGEIVAFRFIVSSNGNVVQQRDVLLETENLPAHLLEEGGDGHRFSDAYFVLPAGAYDVVVIPLVEGPQGLVPSSECMPGEKLGVQVFEGATTEIVVVARCDTPDNGGLDVIAVVNHDPKILDLTFNPSKFIVRCEPLIVTVTAEDPDGDDLEYNWQVEAPPGADYDYYADDNELHFTATTAGDYQATVTVCDTLPDPNSMCTSLSFPIHVSSPDGGPDLCEESPCTCSCGDLECVDGCCAEVAVLQPATQWLEDQKVVEVHREITQADILVTIDPSSSMTSKQQNLACAMDAFAAELSAETRYSVGIVSQNTTCHEDENGNMNGTFPPLIGLQDPSCTAVPCLSCGGASPAAISCEFNDLGTFVTGSTPGGLELLKKTMVIGDYRDEYSCDGDGNGDEASFTPAVLRALAAIEQGDPAPAVVFAVSDESADDDGQACKWVRRNYLSPNLDWFNQVLVDFDPPPLTDSCHQNLSNFYAYFFSTYGCNHDPDGDGAANPEIPNPNPSTNPCTRVYSLCQPDACDIQDEVAIATHGATWSINNCPFDEFLAQMALATSISSTAMCGINPDDPGSLAVTYVENGAHEIVPALSEDGTHGWDFNVGTGCVTLHGSWAPVEGRFEVSFTVTALQPEPRVCLPPEGILPDASSMVVHYETAAGEVVPASASDGWTFDPASNCIEFHGSWAVMPKVEGPFFAELHCCPSAACGDECGEGGDDV